MDYKKVLVTGSSGMLGYDIVSTLYEKNEFKIYGINRNENSNKKCEQFICNLVEFDNLESTLSLINPDVIIHCAANTNVDLCEKEKEYTYNVNAESTGRLAKYSKNRAKFIYISTDAVYGGYKSNNFEKDKPNSQCYYAYAKLEGERKALEENSESVILRINIFGFHRFYKSVSLAEWAIKSLTKRESIKGFKDVYFNPVYSKQLARVVYNFINSKVSGIYNIGSSKSYSKLEFLIKLAEIFNFDKDLIKVSSVDSMNFAAKRGKNLFMDTGKLFDFLGYKIDIIDGLKEFYEDYKNFNRGF